MTPLPAPTRGLEGPWTLVIVATLLAAGTAGCIGDSDDDTDPASIEGFKLFLAASGTEDATARLSSVTVDLNGSGSRSLTSQNPLVDLGELARQDQAQLVANGSGIAGMVDRTIVSFDYLTVGSTNLTGAELSVPVQYPVGPRVEATVTLDLAATVEREEATLDNLVVERNGTRLKAITRSDLEGPDREEIPTLHKPAIRATSATNDTAPSFVVNSDVNFTYLLPPSNATVENVFWSFGDGTTTTGPRVTHAYRSPGFYLVRVILEGQQGQQATANTTIDAYFRTEGEGNVGVGSTGLGAVEGRDTKNHTIDIPGNFTNLTVRLEQSPSGGLCQGGECAPSNVHVEIRNPQGELLARNASDADVKWMNVSGLMDGGSWELRVKGDQGAAVGYSFRIEAHYLGLCASAGGLSGFDCPPEPEPISEPGGPTSS